jgi:hypothetical protein
LSNMGSVSLKRKLRKREWRSVFTHVMSLCSLIVRK